MVEPRTLKGTIVYDEEYDEGHLELHGVLEFNGEEVNVKNHLTNILRDYENKIVEITIKIIEE